MNVQPPERQLNSDGLLLDVHSKWTTIQGEGPYAGNRACFIRLAGCTLQCPLCDTDYTSERRMEKIETIVEWVVHKNFELVVITGGEPFRQNLRPLVMLLCEKLPDLSIQIETNGAVFSDDFPLHLVTVVCSPKTVGLHPAMEHAVDAWKYVLRADSVSQTDGLPVSALGMKGRPARPMNDAPVYIQPCDDKDEELNALNTKAAVDSCLKYGYLLCLQIQKIVGLK